MARKRTLTGKLIILARYFGVPFGISYTLVRFDVVSYKTFIDYEFLFTFIGILLGFAITLFTYITSMFETVKAKLKIKYKDQYQAKVQNLKDLYDEIKDDVNFLFYSLIVVSAFALCAKWLAYFETLSDSALLTIFYLSLLAMKDLIYVAIEISKFVMVDEGDG